MNVHKPIMILYSYCRKLIERNWRFFVIWRKIMKALHCRVCNSLHSLKDSGEPTTCDCGRVTAWYTNADNGLACITAEDHDVAHLLSINNAWINDGPDLIPTAYLDMTTQKQIPY